MDKGKSIAMYENVNGADPIDGGIVRILLCDPNVESCQESFALLTKCSYQVTAVFSATEVINVLNSEGPHTDIILAEADLLMNSGAKILKHIRRDQVLQDIPVIMLLAQDKVSLILKGLGLGATDYLVKPLHMNEVMNLWTYMQRRRFINDGVS